MEKLIQEIEVLSPQGAADFLELIKSCPEEIWEEAAVLSEDGGDYVAEGVRSCDMTTVSRVMEHTNDQYCAYFMDSAMFDICQIYKQVLIDEYPAYIKHWEDECGAHEFQILRYGPSDLYDWHLDEVLTPDAPVGDVGDNRIPKRKISAVLYLNNDFEGGATAFPWREVKPKPGSAVVFPSAFPFLHTGMPVISGVKYVLVTWALGAILKANSPT